MVLHKTVGRVVIPFAILFVASEEGQSLEEGTASSYFAMKERWGWGYVHVALPERLMKSKGF